MNLYGYANGDPINFSDPYGLSACCNPLKGLVGLGNIAWGSVKVLGGAAALVVAGPAGSVWGGTQMAWGGPAQIRRGLQQVYEAGVESLSDADLKNVMGLAPAGQEFDDAGEPHLAEYLLNLAKLYETDPAAAAEQFMKDFLAQPDDVQEPEGPEEVNR